MTLNWHPSSTSHIWQKIFISIPPQQNLVDKRINTNPHSKHMVDKGCLWCRTSTSCGCPSSGGAVLVVSMTTADSPDGPLSLTVSICVKVQTFSQVFSLLDQFSISKKRFIDVFWRTTLSLPRDVSTSETLATKCSCHTNDMPRSAQEVLIHLSVTHVHT